MASRERQLRKQIARLRAALRPFADYDDVVAGEKAEVYREKRPMRIYHDTPDSTPIWCYVGEALPHTRQHLTVGDFRSAKRALK